MRTQLGPAACSLPGDLNRFIMQATQALASHRGTKKVVVELGGRVIMALEVQPGAPQLQLQAGPDAAL